MAVDIQQPQPPAEDPDVVRFHRLCELTDQLFQLNQRPIDIAHPSRRVDAVSHVRSSVLCRFIREILNYMLCDVTIRLPHHSADCSENCDGYAAHHFCRLHSITYVDQLCRVYNEFSGYFLVPSTGFDIYPFVELQPITTHTPSINFRQFFTLTDQTTFSSETHEDEPSAATHFRPLYERWDALVTWIYSIPNRSIQHLQLDLDTVMETMVEIIYSEVGSINQDWHEVRPGVYRPWSQEQFALLAGNAEAEDDSYDYESEDDDEAMAEEMDHVEIS